MPKYTKADADKARAFGDVAEGVAYDWWLVNADGAGFCLLREPHHTDEDILRALAKVRRDRDVVGRIGVAKVEG